MPYRNVRNDARNSDPNVTLQELMQMLSTVISCGGCANLTSVASQHTCKTCGRTLCGECGNLCKDHRKVS